MQKASISIRSAELRDLPQVEAIWRPIVRDTTISFSSEIKTTETIRAMIETRRAAGREFFVAVDADKVLGFATYDQFRGGNGYRHAMEHTIILGADSRGKGVGRMLIAAVCDHARAAGAPE